MVAVFDSFGLYRIFMHASANEVIDDVKTLSRYTVLRLIFIEF